MRRAFLLVTVLVAALMVPGLTTQATAAESAVQKFGACLAGGGQGDLLIVMDTSRSLADSDPGNQRVKAAGYLLEQLATFVGQTDASLDVAVAGFAHDFTVSQDWTALNPGSVGGLVSAVADYEAKTDGWETDYWIALNGARSYLGNKAGPDDCQALVWLSDGVYDLDVRDSAAEREAYGVMKPYGPDIELTTKSAERRFERAGIADLCRAGGVADALRTQGVSTLAIGLQGTQPASAFDLMKGVARGSKVNGKACGAQPGAKAGTFVLAEGIGDLFFAFDELADPDRAPISQTTPLCQGSVCPEGTHQFVLDPSISSVRVLGGTDLSDYYVVLVAPDGKRLQIKSGESRNADLSAGTTKTSWLSDSVFSLQLDRRADRGWSGAWQVAFVDPSSTGKGRARSNIRLYGDLQAVWPGSKSAQLVAGQESDMTIELQRADGSPVQPSDLRGEVSVDATLVRKGEADVVLGKALAANALAQPLAIDLKGVGPGPARVNLALTYTTAAAGSIAGTTLEPQSVDFPVTIAAPPDYPEVPKQIDFGQGDTDEPVTAKVALEGDGCAWLADHKTFTLPDGVKSAPVQSPSDSQEACKPGELSLTLTPDQIGSGLVSGHVTLMTRPAEGNAEPIATSVPFTYEMQRPINQQLFWLAFVVTLLAGLLLPLGLLLLVKWWNARIPGQGLSMLSYKGDVSEHGSFLDILVPDPSKLRNVTLKKGGRVATLNSFAQLETRAGFLRLTEPGHVVVTGAQAVTATGSRLPLAVQGHWVALLGPNNDQVEVFLLLSEEAGSLGKVLEAARSGVPREVAKVRGAGGSPVPTDSGSTSGGQTTSTSEWD